MDASLDDWLQPFEESMMNHDNWLITDQEEEGAAMRKNGGGLGAAFLLNAFGADMKLEDKFDEDEEIATGNQGDLERFFKHGSTGLDTLTLTNAAVKEELPDVNAFSFRWDDDEELKLDGGSDTEDHAPSLLLDSEDQLLLSSGLLSFDDVTLHSTPATSLSSISPSSSLSTFSSVSLSSPSPSQTLFDSKGSNPSSPTPSSSPLPSSPSSILPVAPAPAPNTFQQQQAVSYSHCGSQAMPHYAGFRSGAPTGGRSSNTVCAPPPPSLPMPTVAVQSAPTTPSSSPRVRRARRDSTSSGKVSAAAKKAAPSSTPPRPRRRRAASTTVARDKQDRMEKELAGDDLARAILSGPLTLEKLASLSTLKVSVLQKQLKTVNASTKGAKAQLIQRLVRYMYLFSQQHRHQVHTTCSSTCALQHQSTISRCSGPFIDPTLINADSVRAKTAVERGRSSSIGDGPSILSTSAPSHSIASYLSTHVFPAPLQITLTGRIVEEEEEEEFSD